MYSSRASILAMSLRKRKLLVSLVPTLKLIATLERENATNFGASHFFNFLGGISRFFGFLGRKKSATFPVGFS